MKRFKHNQVNESSLCECSFDLGRIKKSKDVKNLFLF